MRALLVATLLALLPAFPSAVADTPCLPGACITEWESEGCDEGAPGSKQGFIAAVGFLVFVYDNRPCEEGGEGGYTGATAVLVVGVAQAVWWDEPDGAGRIEAFAAASGTGAAVSWGGPDCVVYVVAFAPGAWQPAGVPCPVGPGEPPRVPYRGLLP